ncbi:hypothetical protein PY254_01860 [Rhodanobacter sp. AS-Z3]|uniref:hypothetical protein n=1 Tax=Rhodanobacter sp. AS-Z3 TaxID=3031330 RepID=UPI0024791401|nr:hypothetical protein [Rhodanobacter sp. AS-Z3]WEN15446.1 hypothetical protein PY254_01860 [Rhodanobacter sp. AS-Z3]
MLALDTALAVALGILGGALAHITWLLKFGKSLAQRDKTPPMGKKAKRLRISLMFLSVGFGGAAGFIVALVVDSNHLALSVLITASVLGGLGSGALVRFLGLHGASG